MIGAACVQALPEETRRATLPLSGGERTVGFVLAPHERHVPQGNIRW